MGPKGWNRIGDYKPPAALEGILTALALPSTSIRVRPVAFVCCVFFFYFFKGPIGGL